MTQHSARNQYLTAIIISLGSLCYGLLNGWLPPNITLLLSEETPLDVPMSLDDASWVVSVEFIGNIIGTITFSYVVILIGKKQSACLSILPILVSTLIIVFGTTASHIQISRLIMGIGGGASYSAVPVYITEIAEVRIRGKLGSLYMISLYFGFTAGIVTANYISYYKAIYVIIVVVILSLGLGIVIVPEAPSDLLRKGKKQEADKVLCWLHGKTDEEKPEELQTLNTNYEEIVKPPQKTFDIYKELTTKLTLKGLFIGVTLFIFQQGTGFFAVIYNSAVVFEESGAALSVNVNQIILEAFNNIAFLLSNLLIERAGRRLLLLISSIGVNVTLLLLGLYMYLKFLGVDVAPYNWVPVVVITIYTTVYSIGFGVVPYVLVTEIFATKINVTAVSICIFVSEICSFLVCQYFYSLIASLQWHGCFWFFCAFSSVGSVFIWFYIPETTGKTTDTILMELMGAKNTEKKEKIDETTNNEECDDIANTHIPNTVLDNQFSIIR